MDLRNEKRIINFIKNNVLELVCFGFVFLVYMCRLTDDSIRFDEAIEYLISKNSFESIFSLNLKQFQPPLYNFVLYFLLKISDSIFFYRFTNIIFVMFGTVALYKIVFLTSKNKTLSSISILIMTCFCSSLYYNQISAEYSLVLSMLYWLIYYSIKLIEDNQIKDYFKWTIVSILAMYTQYGAVFAVGAVELVLVIYFIKHHKTAELKKLIVFSSVAIVLFGLPLYFFVARVQMHNQGSRSIFEDGVLSKRYLVEGPFKAFKFIATAWSEVNEPIFWILICLIILSILSLMCINKQIIFTKLEQMIFYVFVLNWFFYYCGVVSQKYAYGIFESRHTLLVMPITIITIAVFITRVVLTTLDNKEKICNKAILICVTGIFGLGMLHGLYYNVIQHWNYSQMDMAMEICEDYIGEEGTGIWMNVMSRPQAIYYLPISETEKAKMYTYAYSYENVIFSQTDDLISDYENNLPHKCIVVWSDVSGDELVREQLIQKGYLETVLYEGVSSKMADGTRVFMFQLEE